MPIPSLTVHDSRREFLKTAGALALVAAGGPILPPNPGTAKSTPESLVKLSYDTFTAKQKEEVCFAWDYVEKQRGLLRTRLENNWKITTPTSRATYYTADQQHLIRKIFEGMTNPDWHERAGIGNSRGMSAASVRINRWPSLASREATSSSSSSPAGT